MTRDEAYHEYDMASDPEAWPCVDHGIADCPDCEVWLEPQRAAAAELDALCAERNELRDRLERALGALSQPNASNYERVQAAGLILTGERPLEKDSAMSASRRKEASDG